MNFDRLNFNQKIMVAALLVVGIGGLLAFGVLTQRSLLAIKQPTLNPSSVAVTPNAVSSGEVLGATVNPLEGAYINPFR